MAETFAAFAKANLLKAAAAAAVPSDEQLSSYSLEQINAFCRVIAHGGRSSGELPACHLALMMMCFTGRMLSTGGAHAYLADVTSDRTPTGTVVYRHHCHQGILFNIKKYIS